MTNATTGGSELLTVDLYDHELSTTAERMQFEAVIPGLKRYVASETKRCLERVSDVREVIRKGR